MLQTFNCGIGMIVVASADKAEAVMERLRESGREPGPHRRDDLACGRRACATAGTLSSDDPRRVAILISGRGSNMVALIEAARARISRPRSRSSFPTPRCGGTWPARGGRDRDPGDRPQGLSGPRGLRAALDAALESTASTFICLAGFMRVLTDGSSSAGRDR